MSSKDNIKTKYLKPAVLILSVLGLLLSVYLTYLHYTEGQTAFCSAGSGCDAVRQSAYSSIFGIPVALLGAIGYALIFWFSYVSMSKRMRWILLYVIALAGFIFSVYLTYIEFFVIKAICPYCVVSAIIMTIIFVIIVFRKEYYYPTLSSLHTALITICVVGIVALGASAFQSDVIDHQQIAGTASSMQVGLAKYLKERGAVMYGSYRCPHCNAQKALFGSASAYINYVECDPSGENANPSLCLSRGIMTYPTWEINGSFYEGAKSLEELSSISGYVPQQ